MLLSVIAERRAWCIVFHAEGWHTLGLKQNMLTTCFIYIEVAININFSFSGFPSIGKDADRGALRVSSVHSTRVEARRGKFLYTGVSVLFSYESLCSDCMFSTYSHIFKRERHEQESWIDISLELESHRVSWHDHSGHLNASLDLGIEKWPTLAQWTESVQYRVNSIKITLYINRCVMGGNLVCLKERPST